MSNEFLGSVDYPHPFADLAVHLCRGALREICIQSPALDHEVFDKGELVDALAALIRDSRQTRVRILIADSRALVARGHRLLSLARRLPSSVHLQRLAEHPDWNGQSVVIRDRNGVLYQPGDSKQGFYEPDSRASTRRHLELFEELWRHSVQDVELRSLTL